MFMPAISGPSMTCSGRPPSALIVCHAASVSSTMKSVMPWTSACESFSSTVFGCSAVPRQARRAESSRDWPLACSAISTRRSPASLPAIEHHVLDALAQLGVEVVVDADHAGVDDAHVHPRLDRVIEEHGVDGFAHRVVAAEREADVGDAARDLRAGQVLLDPARRLDEVDGVVVVLLDAGRDREDVRVEDDVLGREADLVDEDPVGARADLGLRSRTCRPGPARRTPSRPRPRRSGAPAWRGGGTPPRLPSSRSS